MNKSSQSDRSLKASQEIISANLQGKLTAQTFISCLSNLHQELWKNEQNRLLFNLEETDLQSSYGDMAHIVDYANLVSSEKGPAKWAFVTTNEAAEKFVDTFIMLKEKNNLEVKHFHAEQDAAQWLSPIGGTRASYPVIPIPTIPGKF